MQKSHCVILARINYLKTAATSVIKKNTIVILDHEIVGILAAQGAVNVKV